MNHLYRSLTAALLLAGTSPAATAQPKAAGPLQAAQSINLGEHAAKDDHPLYAALEKQRRTAPADSPDYWFHLCPTGPASGLVVEQKRPLGGSLQVYTFQ